MTERHRTSERLNFLSKLARKESRAYNILNEQRDENKYGTECTLAPVVSKKCSNAAKNSFYVQIVRLAARCGVNHSCTGAINELRTDTSNNVDWLKIM